MDRIPALQEILRLSDQFESAADALQEMPFDSDEQIILNVSHIRSVLKRYLSGDVTAEQVLDWADFIEMRDDIDYSDPAVNQAIYVLATPELEGELTPASAEAILNGL